MEKKVFKNQKEQNLLDALIEKGLSYNNCYKILRNKDVKVNGKRLNQNVILKINDVVEFYYKQKETQEEEVVYQDENIIIINKKQGIEIEGEKGLAQKINALPVHRLDRNTTGLIVFAKNEEIREELLEAFKNHTITKKYICHVLGIPKFNGKSYKAYLLKDANKSKVEIFEKKVLGALPIETKFKTIGSVGQTSFVECELVTGRTHQIRAQLAFLGFPIIGDGKYGKNTENKKYKEKYQKLHCFYIKFDKLNKKIKYLNKKEFFKYPDFYKKVD